MEPENAPKQEKERHRPKPRILGFKILVFAGVSIRKASGRVTLSKTNVAIENGP